MRGFAFMEIEAASLYGDVVSTAETLASAHLIRECDLPPAWFPPASNLNSVRSRSRRFVINPSKYGEPRWGLPGSGQPAVAQANNAYHAARVQEADRLARKFRLNRLEVSATWYALDAIDTFPNDRTPEDRGTAAVLAMKRCETLAERCTEFLTVILFPATITLHRRFHGVVTVEIPEAALIPANLPAQINSFIHDQKDERFAEILGADPSSRILKRDWYHVQCELWGHGRKTVTDPGAVANGLHQYGKKWEQEWGGETLPVLQAFLGDLYSSKKLDH